MARRYLFCFLLFFILLFGCSPTQSPPAKTPQATSIPQLGGEPGQLATRRSPEDIRQEIPALATYEAQFETALSLDPPVLRLDDELRSEAERIAQDLALQHPKFIEYTRRRPTGVPLRNEIMSVRPALPGDLTAEATAQCARDNCYRVELYHYASNITTVAVVDVAAPQVLTVEHLSNTQPEINQRLADLAAEIAVNAPEVIEALGLEPDFEAATMPNVKTALNGSRCERSRHLCVAPTFLVGERALWAIVDLTEGRLVGTRWTNLGRTSAPALVTERTLQNEYVMENFCEKTLSLSRDGWDLDYVLTGSDGLQVSNVRFNNQPVLDSAKLVDWHVSYSREEGFGYSDAVGCPMFSSASVVAFDGPVVEDIKQDDQVVGFALIQDFRSAIWPMPCNYRYENRYEFYIDGRFRVVAGNYGRGCGNDGTYRPVMRIQPATVEQGNNSFAEWDGQNWVEWTTEQWQLQTPATPYTPEGFQFKVARADSTGYYIEPGRGQFRAEDRGDNAYTFVTVNHSDQNEGETDMVTIGPCCNTDFRQGPEKFLEPAESLAGQPFVLWYVPQLINDDTPDEEYCWADTVIENGKPVVKTWPCFAGPMFVPFSDEP